MPKEPVPHDGSDRPIAIKLRRQSRVLELTYANGQILSLDFEYLRVFSPSAEVRGHGTGPGKLQTGKRWVHLTLIEPVGNYALKLGFDDGHDSGLYTWPYLKSLGEMYEIYWQDYLDRLAKEGKNREPANH